MPESPDIDTDKLREAVHEELGREGGGFLRRIALTTAVLAAVAAIAALKAGSTANEALVLKTEATRLQAEASDQWAYYQAKGIKLAVAQATEGSAHRRTCSKRSAATRPNKTKSKPRRKPSSASVTRARAKPIICSTSTTASRTRSRCFRSPSPWVPWQP